MPGRLIPLLAALGIGCGHIAAAVFSKLDAKTKPDVFVWTDTCNVCVLRDGDAALLINLGDGRVLEHLPEIGVKPGVSRWPGPKVFQALSGWRQQDWEWPW